VTTHPLRSPLKWVGGKFHAAPRILAAFPPAHTYTTYVEPCGGAAHVLLCKPNWGHREVYNDLNDDLCNFWLQIQLHAEELAQRLQALPYSRHLYYAYHARLFDGSEIEPIERAVMWFYVLRSTGTGWLRSSPVGWNNTVSNALAFRSVLECFKPVQERLCHPRTIIDNRDIERVIEEYDSPHTLFYVDPPYRGVEYYYQVGIRKHAKQSFDHQRLAALLNAAQGSVALSSYPSPELDTWYPPDRWRRLAWQQHKPSALGAGNATELLFMNYAPSLGGLFDGESHV
jgi:DNA adenine methylase